MSENQLIEALADYFKKLEQFCKIHDIHTENCIGCESAYRTAEINFA